MRPRPAATIIPRKAGSVSMPHVWSHSHQGRGVGRRGDLDSQGQVIILRQQESATQDMVVHDRQAQSLGLLEVPSVQGPDGRVGRRLTGDHCFSVPRPARNPQTDASCREVTRSTGRTALVAAKSFGAMRSAGLPTQRCSQATGDHAAPIGQRPLSGQTINKAEPRAVGGVSWL